MRPFFAASVVALAVTAAPAAFAFPITTANPGAPIIVTTTGNIFATYLGNSAAFSSNLVLENTGAFLFNNQTSPVGTVVNLGSFAIGTELRFRLDVLTTGDRWFSGPGSRNADGSPHAAVQNNFGSPGTTLVSFEDLSQTTIPGSARYNDLSFSFTGTLAGAVPEPATWALMILGFGLVGGTMRRRQRVSVSFA